MSPFGTRLRRALLPYPRFTIDTPLPPAVVQGRVEAAIGSTAQSRSSFIDPPFEGDLTGTQFHLRRRIGYRNAFLPRIRGRIEPTTTGSRLTGTMRLHGFVAAFMAVWFAGVGMACIAIVPQAFSGARFDPGSLIPLGMLVFGVLLVVGGFVPEARKAMRQLAQLVEASRWDIH